MEPKLNNLQKIALCGVDGITSAIVLALKRAGFKGKIYGFDKPAVITQAWNNGCVTDGGLEIHDALQHTNLIVLSRSTYDPKSRLASMVELADPDTIILDATTVKGHEDSVFAEFGRTDVRCIGFYLLDVPAEELMMAKPTHFFFEGKVIIMTPRLPDDLPAYRMLAGVFESCGAKVISMAPNDFLERLAMLDYVPDLLEFLELEAVVASTSADKISAAYLGNRLNERLNRLAALHETSWHESLLGTRTHIDSLLSNIQLSIQTLREDLLAETFRDRVTEILAKGDYLQKQAIDTQQDEIIVTTLGDVNVMQRIAKLLSESRVVVSKLEQIQGKTDGAYKIRLDSKDSRNKAASLLKAAGIKVDFKD